ncbi:hypothetical protein GGI19_002225 [Coemansia pectinata]|uniref:Coilin n=1 Tax=Coemansia pectinata TaxID=1052879 RepID=A0A9W8H039_9FUNG|nr:hypothetical protein GGI19_002225 [Coemansia pectinata]
MSSSSSTPRLTLTMRLAPPLPARKFLFVCQQKTVKELKNEIRRRLITLIKEPVAITVDGYELMDDDDVADVLSRDVHIDLHLASSLDQAIAEQSKKPMPPKKEKKVVLPASEVCSPALLTIRKREHGNKKGADLAKRAKHHRVSDSDSSDESSYSGSSDEHPVKVPLGRLSMSSADDDGEYVEDDILLLRADSVDTKYLDKLVNIELAKLEVGALAAYKIKEASGPSNYFIGRVMEISENDITFVVVREVLPTDLPGGPLNAIPSYDTHHQVEHDYIVVAKLFK